MPQLEQLLNPIVDLEPAMARYRHALRAAAESGASPDDHPHAETLAALAAELGLTAPNIRRDFEQFVKMKRLASRFSTTALEKARAELDRVRKADFLYSVTGETAHRMGYTSELFHVCEADQLLDALRERRKQATSDGELAAVREEVAAVEEKKAKLGRRTRLAEDTVVALCGAQDRLGQARQQNRRLFPEDAQQGVE